MDNAENNPVPSFFDAAKLSPGMETLKILGVDYVHLQTAELGDLSVTQYGFPFLEQLLPHNWHDKEWFESHREKLAGTSTVYKVQTKPVNGQSIDIVVKWCRVGEDVPVDTLTLNKFLSVEFNTPYEEFSLVMEMRNQKEYGPIRTHKPLAIYSPPKRFEIWETGRSESKIAVKKQKFRDVELDIYRQYILIYEWIKGYSLVEYLNRTLPGRPEEHQTLLKDMTGMVIDDLEDKGYRVLDMKPAHIIIREKPPGQIMRNRKDEIVYALVDFELLERTPENDGQIKARRRAEYFRRQNTRFFTESRRNFPKHLHHLNIFGVDYIYGSTESTHGILWVVGNDPGLFDYFLPERWRRTPRKLISRYNEIYHTQTKDNIHLVWKVSRMGEQPEEDYARAYGFNSPFEEFAMAVELNHRGINAIYPRAIYMTGNTSQSVIEDPNRYETHRGILMYDGAPAIQKDHNYLTLWGHWNGKAAEPRGTPDTVYFEGMNSFEAHQKGIINDDTYDRLIERAKMKLANTGFSDLRLRGGHLLLSMRLDGTFVTEKYTELPQICFCNFETVQRI